MRGRGGPCPNQLVEYGKNIEKSVGSSWAYRGPRNIATTKSVSIVCKLCCLVMVMASQLPTPPEPVNLSGPSKFTIEDHAIDEFPALKVCPTPGPARREESDE